MSPASSTTDGTTNPSGTDGATAGSADETVGPQPLDRGPCERVEQCLYDTGGAITPFLAVYGEGGTCWEEFPTEACWQDCRAMLAPFQASECPQTPSCCQCTDAADCSEYGEGAACTATYECVDAASTCLLALPEFDECTPPTAETNSWEILCDLLPQECPDETDAFADCVWQCISDPSCTAFDICSDRLAAADYALNCALGLSDACNFYESMVGVCLEELYALASC